MKAEIEDMPEHLRNPKKPGPWRFVAILGVGSAIFWGLITVFAKPIVIDINQIKSGIHVGGTPWFNREQAEPIQAEEIQQYEPAQAPNRTARSERMPQEEAQLRAELEKATEIEWFEEASRDAEHRIQTKFNDQNYQPRGAVNTIAPPPRQYASTSQPPKRTTRRNIEHAGEWIDKWSGGARYFAKWKVINNYIDNGSVCENHGRGSIDYRECRKGAKQYFRDECKDWNERWNRDRESRSERLKTRYCSAASTFNPMG